MLAVSGEGRVRAGISFDADVFMMLERAVKSGAPKGVDRSEVVNAILSAYFSDGGDLGSVRRLVLERRQRLEREGGFLS